MTRLASPQAIAWEKTVTDHDFPLRCPTPQAWAEHALRDPLALLNDHEYCQGRDAPLGLFYRRLTSSELGHYHVFLRLARLAIRSDLVEARWLEMLDFEAAAIAAQQPGPRIHSGWRGSF